MEKYTLSSYEEALKTYDQNVENLKKRHSNEIEELTKDFDKRKQCDESDQFLSSGEKNRLLKKRQEWFDRIKKEKERALKVDLATEDEHKKDFIAQNWWFDYHCFTTLREISKAKEDRLWEIDDEIARKQEELARLQAEIEQRQQEASNLKWDIESIQTGTLHETFFNFDVIPRVKKVESALEQLVEEHKNDYEFPQDFVSRTVRCLNKECRKQDKAWNYEWWKLQLSFDTVQNRTKWESNEISEKVASILSDCWFEVVRMSLTKPDLSGINVSTSNGRISPRLNMRVNEHNFDAQYLRVKLLALNENDIQWRMDIFKQLSFSFADESVFIKQVEAARSEWVNLLVDIDKWLQQYINKLWGIEPRTSDDKKEYYKISLDCNQRNVRILMRFDYEEMTMKILCVAPHVDYDNILRGQTQNYFQIWKWNWTKKWKQWRKTWRA